MAPQVRAQFQIERKLTFTETFKNGQHPTAFGRIQKIIGVFNAACNRFQRQKLPDVEIRELFAYLQRCQSRKDGHEVLPAELDEFRRIERGAGIGARTVVNRAVAAVFIV